MGASASVIDITIDTIDKPRAKELAGNAFDEARFDGAAGDAGVVSVDVWNDEVHKRNSRVVAASFLDSGSKQIAPEKAVEPLAVVEPSESTTTTAGAETSGKEAAVAPPPAGTAAEDSPPTVESQQQEQEQEQENQKQPIVQAGEGGWRHSGEAAPTEVVTVTTAMKSAGGVDGPLPERAQAFLAMDEEGLASQEVFVMETLRTREKARKRKHKEKAKKEAASTAAAYDKSLSGTAEDSKNEKDFSDLMKNPAGYDTFLAEDEFATLLRVMTAAEVGEEVYDSVRSKGKWVKVDWMIHGDGLVGIGYIHTLTCEDCFSKPFDYVEEVGVKEEVADPNCGLEGCDMEDIIDKINELVLGPDGKDATPGSFMDGKTPLLVDYSEDRKMATFFKYKGVVVELECLGWSRKKQQAEKVQVSKVLEEARRRCVVAMKHGKTLCLDLGAMDSACPLKEVHCRENMINALIFERGGKRLISGKPKPFCSKMWKEPEKISGEIVIDQDFKVVVLTSLQPADVLRELAEPLPLDLMHPLVVNVGNG